MSLRAREAAPTDRPLASGAALAIVMFCVSIWFAFAAAATANASALATAGGSDHTLALLWDGTLYSMGQNTYGQLGLGNTTSYKTPMQVADPASGTWTTIAAGYFHSLALTSSGTLYACGENNYYQLGLNDTTNRTSFTQVGSDTDWTAIAGGQYFSLGLQSDGTLWGWGRSNNYQLGLGNTTSQRTPVQIGSGNTWTAITAGMDFSLALRSDGTLWAWGNNNYYQLGLGDTAKRSTPTQVGTCNSWVAIAAGQYQSYALRSDGTLWAWGRNNYYQLGLNDTYSRTTPTQVGTATNWTAVDAGQSFGLALRSDGTLWAWGRNNGGQLGQGNTTTQRTPTEVGTSASWSLIGTGIDFSLGTYTDGSLYTWGTNDYGQLGTGNATSYTSPQKLSLNLLGGAVTTTFACDTSSFGAGVDPLNDPVVDTPVTLSISTNGLRGYTLSAYDTANGLYKSTSPTFAIGRVTAGPGTGVSTFPAIGFGVSGQITAGGTDGAAWATGLQGGQWVGYPSSPAAFLTSTGPTPYGTTDTVVLINRVSVDFSAPAGRYSDTISYALTPNY